ncbi:MAG: hypothetical protein IPK13_28165 [Deltaproteobacteria bacterium]|nr:hypothetical protein [Deltaproteobacteria bacterium]
MWIPTTIETREAILDFTSSEQGWPRVTQLFVDSLLFANAIGLTSWDADAFQPLVCEACGIEGCEPGNWLVARRAGAFAVLLPDFPAMLEDENDATEHAPPAYIRTRGALVLGRDEYHRFRSLASGAREFERLPGLRGNEARRLLQFEAVHNMLGRFPGDVSVRDDHAIACSDGDLTERMRELVELLQGLGDHQPVRLRPASNEAVPVVFYLDDATATEWSPISIEKDRMVLLAAPGLVVERL